MGGGSVVFDVAFDLDLPHGRCVAVALPELGAHGAGPLIPEEILARLHPLEREHAMRLPPGRRTGWVGGRLALRASLAGIAAGDGPILNDARGAPLVPHGAAGSISHKTNLAVGLGALATRWSLGVDLEVVREGRQPQEDLATRILRPAELARLATLPLARQAHEVLWAFSAKEAIYKALDPFVRRFVGFQEVEVERGATGGGALVRVFLKKDEGPFDIEIDEWTGGDLILTTARVRR